MSRAIEHRVTGLATTLLLCMIVSSAAFVSLGILAPVLIGEFRISRTEFGWLLATPTLVSAALSPLAGRFADSRGGRSTILVVVAAGGLALLWMASANSFGWLLAGGLLMGVANAGANPGSNRVIASHVEPGRRGWVVGLKQSAQPIVLLIGGLLLPVLTVTIGWRAALGFLAMAAVPAFVATLALIPTDRPQSTTPGHRTPYGRPSLARWLLAYTALMGLGSSVIVSFLPLYAREELDFSITLAGAASALAGLVGVFARVLWGRGSERTEHFAKPLGLLCIVALISTGSMWAASAGGTWLLWVGVVGAGASMLAWVSVTMLAVVSRVDLQDAGRASALVFVGQMAGFAAGPVLFGFAVDYTGSYDSAFIMVMSFFAGAGYLTVVWRSKDK